MENRNNALHYKMYKSGKNIVYAGLATTAVLAGLTLANVNNTADAATVSGTDTTTCPAPSAVSDAQQAASAAKSAANQQSGAVVAAQAKVDELTQANEGLKQLSAAQQDYSNAQSDFNSASDQYAKVARPAEVKAQNAFQKATNTTTLSAAKSAATKAASDLTVNQAKADSTQSEINVLSDAVATTSASAQQAHENWVANSNAASSASDDYYQALTDGLASDSTEVQDLYAKYNSLNNAATAAANKSQKAHAAYQDALGKFNHRVTQAGGFKDQLNQLNDWIKYDQSVVDASNAYDKAYQDAKALMNAKTDAQVAMSKAHALANQIRKDYNLPTQAQVDAQKQSVKDAQWLLHLANSNAEQNPLYVRATKTIPNRLAQLKQSVGDSSLAQLRAARDVAKANVKSAQKAFDEAMKGNDATAQQNAAIELGKAQAALTNAQQKIQDFNDIKRLETKLESLNNNSSVKASKNDVANREQQLTDAQNKLASMEDNLDAVNKLSDAKAKLATATDLYNQLSQQAKDAQAKADSLQAALDACKNPSKPGDDQQPTKPGSNSNSNANSGANSGAASDANSNVNSGANAGNNATSGAQSGAAASAAQKGVAGNAAAKVAANAHVTRAAYRAQNSNNASANALPQTGNENTAAVVALGAVSAMFGLGLAAKKREF